MDSWDLMPACQAASPPSAGKLPPFRRQQARSNWAVRKDCETRARWRTPGVRVTSTEISMRVLFKLWVFAWLFCGAATAQTAPDGGGVLKRMDAPSVGVESTLAPLRTLLATPDAQVDFARAKLTIDHLIDPRIDIDAVLRDLDGMADQVRAMVPPGSGRRATLVTLMSYLYQPGPWNSGRPFRYDLDDPFGKDLRNKLLTTYLATAKAIACRCRSCS